MFGIVFNNRNLVHQYMFKLKKAKIIVEICRNLQFPYKFLFTNSLSHEETLILKVPLERREQFYQYPVACR